MDAQQFFKKNLRYVTIGLLLLFLIKGVQSCNRNIMIKRKDKEIIELNDSLNTMYGTEKALLVLELQEANDSIKELNYLVKLANAGKDAAYKRADAVQSTAEKIRENTTIKIENNSRNDTVSINNR